MDAAPSGLPHTDSKVVLLLDEIDKADPDLPNALLEVLAGDGFQVQVPGVDPVVCEKGQRPLIIITTNEDRELPPAFLRRCFCITLSLPADIKGHCVAVAERHQAHLVQLGQRTPSQICEKTVLELAADQLLHAREDARQQQRTPPATAEYLDLVRALATLFPGDAARQAAELKYLARYALDKSLAVAG